MTYHDPYRATSMQPEGASAPRVAVPEDESKKVPSGTGKEILAWVDGDAERAQRAFDVETAHEHPRIGLTRSLNEIIGAEDE